MDATAIAPRHVLLTAASSVSDSMPAGHRLPPLTDGTSPKSGRGTMNTLAPSGDIRPAAVQISESQPIDRGLAERTPGFRAVCQQADALNRHGFELAQRGAIYSARQEYRQSLQTIADALDAQRGSGAHRRMLAAGFKALDEADDFAADDNGSGAEINAAKIAHSHQSPVLKEEVKADCSAQAAMGRYLTYAQEQLAGAVGDVPQGSAALFGLGKVYSVPLAAHGPKDSSGGAKSVAFYQASLMVDGRNFMAANELGVALVRFGRLPEARAAFLHSLAISSQPIVWQNLAAVHQNLGEIELAERARRSAIVAANQTGSGAALAAYDVQWVDPATFARAKPIDADPINRVASSKQATTSK
jgi:tetratricopeptide (TPR) repeat protein